MKKLIFLVSMLISIQFSIIAQTITKTVTGPISGTTCPNIGIQYEVTRPSGLTSCQITWSASNGQISGPNNQTTVIVVWSDTPGVKGKVTATFTNCGNSNDNVAPSSNGG